MVQVHSAILLKGDLQAQIEAALETLESIPSRDQGEEIYRAGFRTALSLIATTNRLNIPALRNAQADARRRNRAVTVYDQRL